MSERQSSRVGASGLFLLAVVFLAFVGGVIATSAGVFPATYVQSAYRAGVALYAKLTTYHDPLASDLWPYARVNAAGIVTADFNRNYPGLTLYTSGDGARARLIAPSGALAYEWSLPYSKIWDKSAAAQAPVADNQVYFRKAHLYPNGDVLVIYEAVGDSPYGYGLAKLDRHSRVIWKNLDHFHHDFTIGSDGLIYGLTHRYRSRMVKDVDHLKPPVLEDFLAVVSPEDGHTIRKISLLNAFRDSDYRRYLWLVPYYSLEDPLHSNGVKVLEGEGAEQLAAKIPGAAPGQLLLSFREMGNGVIALLDPDKKQIVWATRGPWHAQHDVDLLANGDLLLFDNLGHFGPGGKSRVIEFDPATHAIAWSYTGKAQDEFESLIRGSQERLPNGNTLITESQGGRLFEVTQEGETVWEFVTPVRDRKTHKQLPIVSFGQRIDPNALDPDFHRTVLGNLQAQDKETE